MHARMALLPLVLWGVGCGKPADTYPQAWSFGVSPQAIELVEDVGWDAVAFYELVCVHAESIEDDAGLVGVNGKPGGELGVLGSAVRGSARAEVWVLLRELADGNRALDLSFRRNDRLDVHLVIEAPTDQQEKNKKPAHIHTSPDPPPF